LCRIGTYSDGCLVPLGDAAQSRLNESTDVHAHSLLLVFATQGGGDRAGAAVAGILAVVGTTSPGTAHRKNATMPKCSKCGAGISIFAADLSGKDTLCDGCKEAIRTNALIKAEEARKAATKVILTTTHNIDGHTIENYLGIESVEYVIGTGLFSEMSGEISDFFGARSKGFEKKLQIAKQQAMVALKILAAEKGANAVVGVDLDYTEFSGNRVGLILNGTLVRVVPKH
jgi:uncharacterized protein YbjQ (UPF0145 family)